MKISSILKSVVLVGLYIYFIKCTVIYFINQVRKFKEKNLISEIIETILYIAIFAVTLGFLYLVMNVIYYILQYNI